MRAAMPFAFAILIAAAAAAHAAPKQTDPLLTKVRKSHCLAMYDYVAKTLKGNAEMVSVATRNGLKDFFVTRPGKVDCTGQRELPWRNDKDREFIAAAIKASKADMGKLYAVAPAGKPVQ